MGLPPVVRLCYNVILSAAKNLVTPLMALRVQILRCSQNDKFAHEPKVLMR
jgi:hypothetical protein